MTVFKYSCYRTYLKDEFARRRNLDDSWSYAHIARETKIQKSYISNVINHRADLNSDQLFRICRLLQLEVEEFEYLDLLLELSKCNDSERRNYLERKKSTLQSGSSEQRRSLSAENVPASRDMSAKYYASPTCPIVHMLLSVPEFCHAPKKIAQRIGIDGDHLAECLRTLESCGVIESTARGYKQVSEQIHLSSNTDLSVLHALNFRMLALERQRSRRDDSSEFLTLTFSADQDAYDQVRRQWHRTLKDVSDIIRSAPAQDVFQINLDLFRI